MLITCPQKCLMKLKYKDKDEHLKKLCPEVDILCSICNLKIKRKNSEIHEVKSMDQHRKIVSDLKKELLQLKGQTLHKNDNT